MNRFRRATRPFTLFVVIGVGMGGLLACSCSKRSAGAKGGAKLAPSAGAAPRVEDDAKALCSALHELPSRRRAECCSEPPVSLYVDQCVRLLSSAARAKTLRIDGSKTAECAARVAERTRGCDWVRPTMAPAPPECEDAVTGLVEEGGRCTSSLECKGALHCAGQGATTPGVCRAPQSVGGACGTSVDSLATYLGVRALEARKPPCDEFCDLTTHRCEAKPAVGSSCHASVNCASDQACRNGRCEALEGASRALRSLPGGACATDLDCEVGGCVANAAGERHCTKKCSNELASFTGRPSLPLGRSGSARPNARTSTGSESASP